MLTFKIDFRISKFRINFWLILCARTEEERKEIRRPNDFIIFLFCAHSKIKTN